MSGNFFSLKGIRLPYVLYPTLLHGCAALREPQLHAWGLSDGVLQSWHRAPQPVCRYQTGSARQPPALTPYSQGGRASAPQNLPHARAGRVGGALSTLWVCVGGQLTHLQLSLVDGCTAGLGLVFET